MLNKEAPKAIGAHSKEALKSNKSVQQGGWKLVRAPNKEMTMKYTKSVQQGYDEKNTIA